MTPERGAELVEAFLAERFPGALSGGADEYFADTGVLTSLESVTLIAEFEDRFALQVPDADVTEENFGSRSGLARYLTARRDRS
jgi:acyl carrier protein